MTDLYSFIISLIFVFSVGWVFLSRLFPEQSKLSFLERVFIGYGLGFGYITLGMFLLSIVNLKFTLPHILLFLLLTIFTVKSGGRKRGAEKFDRLENPNREKQKLRPFDLALLFLCSLSAIRFIIGTIFLENDTWDSWAVWGFKAKVFFYHQRIPFELFDQLKTTWGNWDYPLHVSLMTTWGLMFIGEANDYLFRLVFPLYSMGLAIVVFEFLRRYLPLRIASIGLFFLMTLYIFHWLSMGTIADPILLFYYIISFLLLYRWIQEADHRLLWLSAIFVGLAAWTKNEGLFLLVCNLAILITFLIASGNNALSVLKNKLFWKYFLLAIAPVLPWRVIIQLWGLTNSAVNPQIFDINLVIHHLSRLPSLGHFLVYFFITHFAAWSCVWIMFLTFCLFSFLQKERNPNVKYVLIPIFLQFLMFIFFYVAIPDLQWYLQDSAQRFMLEPAILSIIFCCLSLQTNDNNSRGQ